MENISSRKNLIKDGAILLALAALLVALPLIKTVLEESSTQPSESDTATIRVQEIGSSDNQELAFIEEVLPKLASWEVDAIAPYLTQETKQGDWEGDVQPVLSILSERLGDLQRHENPKLLHEAEPIQTQLGEGLSVYELVAFYEHGIADIDLVIAEDGGEPALYSFNIDVQGASASL